jgi:hypothetical protein
MAVFWDVAPCSVVDTDVSKKLTASIIRVMMMMEAANSSETSVNIYKTTWHNIPEDNHLILNTIRT